MDQAIYGFGGAEPDWLIQLSQEYPTTILDQSWRVPEGPHAVAQAIIRRNSRRVQKEYRPRKATGSVVPLTRSAALASIVVGEPTFILCRNVSTVRSIVGDLFHTSIPYVSERGGINPLGRAKLLSAFNTAVRVHRRLPVTWAEFGVHWPTREEIWWWLPTGNRDTCDLVLIGCYSGLAAGGPMRWRIDRIPATAACVVPRFNFGGAAGADVLMVATPDGWLMQYPHAGGIDGDTRVTVTDADRYVAGCTFNSGTGVLTATGTAWPTARYGLRGCFAAVRDANGACYAARITANTGTTLTLTFLTGRLPPASGLEVAVGGLPAFAQTHWFGIAGDDEHAAIWRWWTGRPGSWASRATWTPTPS
jgi:hypothetical protein